MLTEYAQYGVRYDGPEGDSLEYSSCEITSRIYLVDRYIFQYKCWVNNVVSTQTTDLSMVRSHYLSTIGRNRPIGSSLFRFQSMRNFVYSSHRVLSFWRIVQVILYHRRNDLNNLFIILHRPGDGVAWEDCTFGSDQPHLSGWIAATLSTFTHSGQWL